MLGPLIVRWVWLIVAFFSTWVAVLMAPACKDDSPPGVGGGGGTGGVGGCPSELEAQFTLTITAADGALPESLRMTVTWSAGPEPEFVLADPNTHVGLEDSNVVCGVDPEVEPEDRDSLVCKLWTSGATRVEVTADDYEPVDETFTPELIDDCDVPLPSDVEVELTPAMDAGSR